MAHACVSLSVLIFSVHCSSLHVVPVSRNAIILQHECTLLKVKVEDHPLHLSVVESAKESTDTANGH